MPTSDDNNRALAASLSHVLWIGGSTDAGKTTTATLLAQRHGLQVYHQDRSFSSTGDGYDPEIQTHFHRWVEMSEDERWLRPSEVITQHMFDMWPQGFPAHVERILSMPNDTPIVAEGYCFIPELIAPILSSPHQALWIIPTESFKRTSFYRRSKDKYREREGSSDPERATYNFFMRDILIGKRIQTEAEHRNLKLVQADGTRSQGEMADFVAGHFRTYLPQIFT